MNRTHRHTALPALLLLGACATQAPAPQDPAAADNLVISSDRPSFSDGTGLVPAGHLQLETGYTYTRRQQNGVTTERHAAPEVLARYRVLDALEARLTWSGWLAQSVDGAGIDDHAAGASDLTLGVKLPIADQDGLVPNLVFISQVTGGTGDDFFSTGSHAVPTEKLAWAYTLDGSYGLGGNLVWSLPHAGGDRYSQTAASIYGTWTVVDGTTLFGEYYLVTPFASGTNESHNVDFGVLHLLSNRVQFDARVGFGLDEDADDFFTGVGLSFLF